MAMHSCLAEIIDGRLVLPDDALALFAHASRVRVITDTERRIVSVYAKDPMAPPSPEAVEFQQVLESLSEDSTDEEYFAPVTDHTLREIKRKRQEREGSL